MASFGSSGYGARPGEKVDESKLMSEVQQNLRAQMVQEFFQTVRDKCFKVCVTSPSSALSKNEQKCLANCMDRYQDATNVVSQAVVSQGH